MDEAQNRVIEKNKPVLFSGGALYFLFFSAVFWYVSSNWLYALCFSCLCVSVMRKFCYNRPLDGMADLLSIPCVLLWIPFSRLVSAGVIRALHRNISNEQLEGALERFSSTYAVQGKVTLPEALIFLIVVPVIVLIIGKLVHLLEDVSLPEKVHAVIVFASRFCGLLLYAAVSFIVLSWGLKQISMPSGLAAAVFILPPLFCLKTWKNAVKDVAEYSASLKKDPASDGNDKKAVKSIRIPELKLCDVAGMQQVKNEIMVRMIKPIHDPKAAEKHGIKPGGGLLLYGPPGTGKTYIAKAVAGELKIPFYAITAADIFSKYVGESEQNIKNIFAEIRKNKLSVLFIDELESIFRKRSDEIHETTRKIISIILQELDGIDSCNNGMLLIGATNTPHLLDEAFLRTGRFDVQIFVGMPDISARLQILESCFADVKCPIEQGLLEALAECTENFSGADLKGFSLKVKQRAFAVNAKVYDHALFQECLSGIYPSPHTELMRNIRAWEAAGRNR